MRVLVAIVALGFPVFNAGAQSLPVSAADIAARIVERSGVQVPANTVDKFKAGDPQTRVRGITVTMMATLDVLKSAVKHGDNLIITHEPTFYNHRDTLGVLESEEDSVLAAKLKFIRDNGLVVWRFHDIPHLMIPDMMDSGIGKALGWNAFRRQGMDDVYDIPPTSTEELARLMGARLGARSMRMSGNPKARVSRVVLTQGFPGFASNRHAIQAANPDVVIIGEDHEWETIEYVVDAISAGRIKALLVIGHIPSEQAGMQEFAGWLRGMVTEVPIHFVPTPDPFVPIG